MKHQKFALTIMAAATGLTLAGGDKAQHHTAPMALDMWVQAHERHSLTIHLKSSTQHSDGMVYKIIQFPENGVIRQQRGSHVDYISNAGFAGVDQFTFLILDGKHTSNTATVTIDVMPSPGEGRWLHLSEGPQHSCGVAADGTLWCWGTNRRGQLGLGFTSASEGARQVGTADDWLEVTVDEITCGIRKGYSLWCWGEEFGATPKRVDRASGVQDASIQQ